jgi:ubiquinone/menaquinone biosynthesis C-methylase UbiE
VERATDPRYLLEQYGTTDRLKIRIETHQRYSERGDDFLDWVLGHLDAAPGELVLDVGCGTGHYHPALCARGVQVVVGLDASPTMVAASQRQASELHLPVVAILGDAQQLPLPDGAYDRVMANHVFFFVPDQREALREMRRVRKPNGRVLLVTNAADHGQRLEALHEQAAQRLGYTPTARVGARFNLDHLSMVQEVFPTARCFVRPDAFLFPTTESTLRYYATGPIDAIVDPPTDASHRPKLLELVGEQIEAIISHEGVFRVPKNAGCFVAHD